MKEARSILKEYKKKNTLDDLTELIEEDIADVEWEIAEGILEPYSPEAEPPIVPEEQKDIFTPESFALFQNQPNPGNPITTIHYQLPEASKVTLKIYDLLGKEVRTLVNDHRQAGVYSIVWNLYIYSSGRQ